LLHVEGSGRPHAIGINHPEGKDFEVVIADGQSIDVDGSAGTVRLLSACD
jgi:hypothetical protein